MKRRSKGTGTIYARKDGRFTGKLWLTDASGRKRRYQVFGRTKIEVVDKMRSLQVRQSTHSLVAPDQTSLSSFLVQWLRDVIVPTKRLGTAMSYESVCRNHLIPMLGKRPRRYVRRWHGTS